MQVETRIIRETSRVKKGASISGPAGRPITQPAEPWKELKVDRRTTGFDKPAFARHVTQEQLDADDRVFYGRYYSFNTKYVVDVEEDDTIGCVITLASGATKHIDMPASVVTQQCNRR